MIGPVVQLKDETVTYILWEESDGRRFIVNHNHPRVPNRDYHFEQLAYQPIGPDEELATVLTQAKGDPEAALKGWLQIARPRLPAKEGVRLVPSQIQELLQLSVRQLFIGTHEVWEIGAPFSNDEFHRPCGTIIRRLL